MNEGTRTANLQVGSPQGIVMPDDWKRWLFKSMGFGAGLGVVLAALATLGMWYSSRPKPPKPWNKSAIRASYQSLEAGNGEKAIFVTLTYAVENTTDYDYRLPSSQKIMALKSDNVLDDIAKDWMPVELFVPAHHRVQLRFSFPVGDVFDSVKAKEDDKWISKTAGSYLSTTKGFVVFDEVNRYEIALPSGWSGLKE